MKKDGNTKSSPRDNLTVDSTAPADLRPALTTNPDTLVDYDGGRQRHAIVLTREDAELSNGDPSRLCTRGLGRDVQRSKLL